MQQDTITIRVSPDLAAVCCRCFKNYCDKHGIDFQIKERRQTGWWIFKTEVVVFIITGPSRALNKAGSRFRRALWS